mmetsp:Transcript_32482/g.82002  ORF Transcript_32482/g.82002 Transcript_32482/m.82002 type:complete len:220 (-) Transcript_32482:262-921(-)
MSWTSRCSAGCRPTGSAACWRPSGTSRTSCHTWWPTGRPRGVYPTRSRATRGPPSPPGCRFSPSAAASGCPAPSVTPWPSRTPRCPTAARPRSTTSTSCRPTPKAQAPTPPRPPRPGCAGRGAAGLQPPWRSPGGRFRGSCGAWRTWAWRRRRCSWAPGCSTWRPCAARWPPGSPRPTRWSSSSPAPAAAWPPGSRASPRFWTWRCCRSTRTCCPTSTT